MALAMMMVPVRDNDGKLIEDEHWADLDVNLARIFGGFTVWPAEGVWIDADDPLHPLMEDDSMCYMIVGSDDTAYRNEGDKPYPSQSFTEAIMRQAKKVAKNWRQKCVFVLIDGIPHYVAAGE